MTRMHNPPHPGAVLQQWLADVSVTQAASLLCVTRAYLSRILHGHAGISADMALWQAAQQPRPSVQRLVLSA